MRAAVKAARIHRIAPGARAMRQERCGMEQSSEPEVKLLYIHEDELIALRRELERLRADRALVYAWMREPDHVAVANLDWAIDWINRRPIASTA
jgi:hypothetical protein